SVDGYVFDDANHNRAKDLGEAGVPGATVRLGTFSATTSASGYFYFSVEAGSYTLRNVPPMGYGVFDSPDSFVVNVPPTATQSLADTARVGGWINLFGFK